LKQSARDAGADAGDQVKGSNGGSGKKQRRQILAQRRQQLKPRRDRVRQLEQSLQQLQEKLTVLNGVLNDPGTYQTESTSNLANMMQQKSDLDRKLEQTESSWVESMEELEQLERLVESRAL
jgi:ATP-binding cassette subfamily F protein 3